MDSPSVSTIKTKIHTRVRILLFCEGRKLAFESGQNNKIRNVRQHMPIFVLQDLKGGPNAPSALNPDIFKVYFLKST